MAIAQDIHRQLLDLLFNDGTYTPPANTFVGLSTTTPTSTGTNVTEPSGNGYARVSTAAADWDAAVAGDPCTKANGNPVTFPTATGAWAGGANMTHFVLYSQATGGTFLGSGALGTPKAVATDDTPEFAAGQLVAKMGASTDTF